MNNVRSKLEQNLGWILLALVLIGCVLVLRHFISALLWGGILSFSVWPLYRRLASFLGGRSTLAAVVISLGMIGLVLLPFLVIGLTLTDNVRELTTATQRWIADGPPSPPAWLAKVPIVGKSVAGTWQNFAADTSKLAEAAKRFVEPVGGWLLKAGLLLGQGLFQLALSILITFFLLRHGPAVGRTLNATLGRIGGDRAEHLLELAGSTVRGVVYGILGTALVQAVMAGFGFLIAGVPGAGLLALLVFFLSVVPAGPFLVVLPAALWLFHEGATAWGVFMLIWAVVVSTIDNFVKPWLISQGSDMPLVLILFGVLGGALTFGFIGVFIGPTLLAVGYRLFDEWTTSRETGPSASAGTVEPAPAVTK